MAATNLCPAPPRRDYVHFTERKTECREVELPSAGHTVCLWLAGQTHQAQGTRGTAVGYNCDPEGAQPSSQTLPMALQALLCGLELLPFLQ